MELEAFVQKKKEIYSTLLNFIDTSDDYQEEFKLLIQTLENHEVFQNREDTFNLLHLISKIEDNHRRTPNFYEKFEQIFNYIIKEKQFPISNAEIFQIYKNSKRMLLLLLEKNLLIPDESILDQIFQMRDFNGYKYSLYLYSGIKPYINESQQNDLEKIITKSYDKDIDNFIKKCQIGENDSELCSLIRQDLLEDFISYLKTNDLPVSTKIERSIFETNSFLISVDKRPSLIEYAAFYGSMQIIQYLKERKAKLKFKLWYFSVHSNNSEVIQFCEENGFVKKVDNSTELIIFDTKFYKSQNRSKDKDNLKILREAVKCHHNGIYERIKGMLISFKCDEKFIDFIDSYIVDFYDYYFYPESISDLISQKNKDYDGFNMPFLCSSFSKIVIPSSVIKIGSSCFYGCSSLSEVIIPDSVTKIGSSAFCECTSLVEILIPSSVTKIGKNCFKGCLNLANVEIPSSITMISNGAFDGCVKLVEIEIPSSVTVIGNAVFYGCKSLEKVEIPLSVTSFGDCCFANCIALKEIEIPPSVMSIGNRCFDGCSALSQISIPSSVERIGEHAFNGCVLLNNVEFVNPSSVIGIGNFAFFGCSSLVHLSIPSSVSEIGENVFTGCSSLKSVALPTSVAYIGVNAFPPGTKIV